MKVLWTVSNWKRTGPVEPSLDLAMAFRARGHEVQVACGRAPRGEDEECAETAAARGLAVAETGATLAKHAWPLRDWGDVRRLRAWIQEESPDGLVATHRNGHRLLLRAARGLDVPVVRLWFGDGRTRPERRDLAALRRSDGVLVFGERARLQLEELGLAPARVARTGPPLDVQALRAQVGDVAAVRAEHGIDPDAFLFGIVARLQTHRRFEDLWGAVSRLRIDGPPFHVLVVGRGTNAETVARRPVRELGLEGHVTLCGYLRGEAYATTLAAFDAQLLLVPGSDPTCRALREGMALGVPGIAAERGMLPEIVEDGVSGLVFGQGMDDLALAMRRMAEMPEAARILGDQARARAEVLFDAPRVARALERLWARIREA